MSDTSGSGRRHFLKTLTAGAVAATTPAADAQSGNVAPAPPTQTSKQTAIRRERIAYPRVFSGRQTEMLAFPLGGIGTGSISLGGRGQLRDWEIYNRPDKGRSPEYAFASLWVKSADGKPVAHVLESRLTTPYASTAGLGPANAPGLSRLESATFTGEFPLAHIDFHDTRLPVRVSLDAFSPFIPLDPDNSGFPAAVLRYRVRNPGKTKVTASIAFTLDNPAGRSAAGSVRRAAGDGRSNEFRKSGDLLQGIFMSNSALPEADPERGTFALCVLQPSGGRVSYLRGWPNAKWWASPMLFWDDFSTDGQLGPEAADRKLTASLCLQREIEPGAEAEYTFLLAWHFPNRTPAWSGWTAPKGHENTVIGNYYCTQFADAWVAAQRTAEKLPELEKRTKNFVSAIRASTLPGSVRDAAMSNLSTLVTQTSFRTADGEFHGFEGCSDHRGCCFGNCTHVWNYETSTQFVFPSLARSLRKAAFGFSQDEQGGMRFRQMLPDGIDRFGYAAADGQMGQIIKTYLDWKLGSDKPGGDVDWLRGYWPNVQRALAYAWIPGGWDANRDGVMEGVQHNTYDVEFYGPNPLGGVYYLGALRAAEEMARALGDTAKAEEYHGLFEKGRAWVDSNLFNGEYYIQKVRSIPRDQIAPSTVGDMGADHPESPEFQLGDGCLADQLIGQYLADIAGLGPLLDPVKIRKTLASIHKYNFRRNLFDHDSVQRIYALNDEPAILVCDYGKGTRPKIPFPYYAEAWTGIEYLVAAQFIYGGMLREGLETIEDVRWRFDGERRNPWDEPECGHHYARAMSAWSSVVALSGFEYHAADKAITLTPRLESPNFVSFWSNGTGWGSFSIGHKNGRRSVELTVVEGALPLKSVHLSRSIIPGSTASVVLNDKTYAHQVSRNSKTTDIVLTEDVSIPSGGKLVIQI
jgi:non-lysosomal glucosylceramidase